MRSGRDCEVTWVILNAYSYTEKWNTDLRSVPLLWGGHTVRFMIWLLVEKHWPSICTSAMRRSGCKMICFILNLNAYTGVTVHCAMKVETLTCDLYLSTTRTSGCEMTWMLTLQSLCNETNTDLRSAPLPPGVQAVGWPPQPPSWTGPACLHRGRSRQISPALHDAFQWSDRNTNRTNDFLYFNIFMRQW